MRGPLGLCDRCDRQVKLSALRGEFKAGRETGVLVCRSCWDDDHPQLFLHEIVADDPKPVRNPRPEVRSNLGGLFGWPTLGNPETYLQASTGRLNVRIG